MWTKHLLAWTIPAVLVAASAAAQEGPAAPAKTGEKQALEAFFADLANGEWELKGNWTSGGSVHWITRYDLALGGRIVKAQKLSPEGAAAGAIEIRNEGIRAWDETTGAMRFWEFDRFGGITTGRVLAENGSFYYEYTYPVGGRERTLRDEWRKREDGAYDHRVGLWGNGAWEQVLLTAIFRRGKRQDP